VALAIRRLLQFQIEMGNRLGFDRPSLDWSVLFLALTGPAGIVIHEGGHYLAGIALGQCCRRFVVGPVEVARRAGRWTARWIPIRQAGLVDLVPSTFDRFRLRRAVSVAGGPVASLAAGLVFTGLSLRAATPSPFWIWNCCAQWCLIGVLGLLPMRRGTARSDGYLLWELIRGGSAVDELERNLLVASSYATPLRMREWPHDLIRRLVEVPADRQARCYNRYLAYVHFLDRGESQVAGRHLERLLSEWKAGDPPEYALEAAYFLASHAEDLESARRWLASEDRDAEPWVRLRAQAAIARSSGAPECGTDDRFLSSVVPASPRQTTEGDGQPLSARRLVDEALSRLQAAPPSGALEYEIDRLRGLL
jgi:hypothetical protein